MIQRLCVIGVGLIGGSFARALRSAGACSEVVGCGRDLHSLQRAVELGVIDRYDADPSRAVQGADVVVLAVPVGAVEGVMKRLWPALSPSAVVTDVGSTKGSVVEAVRRAIGSLPECFVPGHPIAGTERSGVDASFAELFRQRRVILTPLPNTDPVAVDTVRRLWEICGAKVVEMDPQRHDEILAATSHLPHMLAFTLVDTLARLEEYPAIFDFAAGGFRDFTRIASSDPAMWRDIALANGPAILGMIDRFRGELDQLARAIERGDGTAIHDTFQRAKRARDQYSEGAVKSPRTTEER